MSHLACCQPHFPFGSEHNDSRLADDRVAGDLLTVTSPDTLAKGTNGIVHVMPETRSAYDVFGSYDVVPRRLPQTAAQATQGHFMTM
jgi:hypothetical protein